MCAKLNYFTQIEPSNSSILGLKYIPKFFTVYIIFPHIGLEFRDKMGLDRQLFSRAIYAMWFGGNLRPQSAKYGKRTPNFISFPGPHGGSYITSERLSFL